MLVFTLAIPIPFQLLAIAQEKQWMMAKVLGVPATLAGILEVPASWLSFGPIPAISAIWEVNQQMDDLSNTFK